MAYIICPERIVLGVLCRMCRDVKQIVYKMKNIVIAEYVWQGGKCACDMRSKSRTLVGPIQSIEHIPMWQCDGSSCGLSEVNRSDVYLKPVQVFSDPFRGHPHILVLCESVQRQ